ncbi:hypothetical protein JTE90_005767 [Oedothorax gibbosus]|uniref:Uncharacterized protein n=1 Tax=Oedothorax gibbosus TaxID=931172 RepID=A0AAV6UTT6_9ARAC|nr:hypothetical protein JTE90_005767 [Oedothorax gibbosus]
MIGDQRPLLLSSPRCPQPTQGDESALLSLRRKLKFRIFQLTVTHPSGLAMTELTENLTTREKVHERILKNSAGLKDVLLIIVSVFDFK